MSDWRRIDIDAYDLSSGKLTADDLKPPYSNRATLQDLRPVISQIRSAISTGDFIKGIQLATDDPPYRADEEIKHHYFLAILELLTQVKHADVSNIVRQLERHQQDVLVKYLYKVMSFPEGQKQGGILLWWFDKIIAQLGINPIMRYLSDRNTL